MAKNLTQLVNVEFLGENAYRAKNLFAFKWMRAVYGGQVVGQALMAASMSVHDLNPSFLLHSFHCYFVGPMRTTPEVIYHVTRVKEGKNFCSVSVVAVQSDKVCFHCLVSFQKPEAVTAELDYCSQLMPAVPHPSDSDSIAMSELSDRDDKDKIAVNMQKFVTRGMDIEDAWSLEGYMCIEVGTVKKFLAKEPVPPKRLTWMKTRNTFTETDHQNYHRIAMAYASDFFLAGMVRLMYPKFEAGLITSLDHSMWFHRPVDSNKWYLHVADVKDSMDGRALNGLRIFSEDGQVVATCMQESLIRPKL